jgi:uncharacterized cupredoxin-like copper-binding protein
MKKLVTLLAVWLTALTLVACGGSQHHKTDTTGPASPPANAATSTVATSTAPPATSPTGAPTPSSAAAHTVDIAANPSGMLKYTESQISTTAGKVTIDFTNSAPLAHDVVLIDSPTYSPSAKILGQTPQFQGGSKSFTVTLTPGKYYFYCSVPGHRQAGMFGTLTVS